MKKTVTCVEITPQLHFNIVFRHLFRKGAARYTACLWNLEGKHLQPLSASTFFFGEGNAVNGKESTNVVQVLVYLGQGCSEVHRLPVKCGKHV